MNNTVVRNFLFSQNNTGAFCGYFWAFGHPVVHRSLRAVVFQQSKVGSNSFLSAQVNS
jgi:ABC-type polysaccharide/polyol phosphate export permease